MEKKKKKKKKKGTKKMNIKLLLENPNQNITLSLEKMNTHNKTVYGKKEKEIYNIDIRRPLKSFSVSGTIFSHSKTENPYTCQLP